MSENLRQFYFQVINDKQKNSSLKLNSTYGCLMDGFALLFAWMASEPALSALSGPRPVEAIPALAVLALIVGWFIWRSRPYRGPIYLYLGMVTEETTISTSSAEIPVSVVSWSEKYRLNEDGNCERVDLRQSTYTRLDTSCPIGGTLRLVMAHATEICPVPRELELPGSQVIVGPDYGKGRVDPERQAFFQKAEQQFQAGPMFAIVLDIDHLGQQADKASGDAAVAAVLQNIRSFFGTAGNVGHFGGDEFYISQPGTLEQARALAERLRLRIESKTRVTVSLGVAAQGESLAELISSADKALKQAKSEGRNRVQSA